MHHRGEIEFELDAFISYAHIDDAKLSPDDEGWVTALHRVLEFRVAQLLGRDPRIWRDPTIHRNDDFAKVLINRVRNAAALIAVVSPRYVRSEWARTELATFCQAAAEQGGLLVGERARVFKVLKTHVDRDDHPPELQPYLGYEFYTTDPDTGTMREYWGAFGPESERAFLTKAFDLAHGVVSIINLLEGDEGDEGDEGGTGGGDSTAPGAVYLAETTSDLKEQRDLVRRGLEQHGYTVLPDRDLPVEASGIEAAVREDLARCRMSIHMIGRTYSFVPEGGFTSLLEMQNSLARERAASQANATNDVNAANAAGAPFPRLLWIPPGLESDDARQQRVLQELRSDPHVPPGTDLLETSLQELQTFIHARLRPAPVVAARAPAPRLGAVRQVYLIFDRRDAEAIAPWADLLFAQGVEVIRSLFDGDDAELSAYHRDNLQSCDGALIFHGAGNEMWLRSKLREIRKSAGYGRTQPVRGVGVCLIGPRTSEKEGFRTHEAMLIPGWDGVSADGLQPFLARLLADADDPEALG